MIRTLFFVLIGCVVVAMLPLWVLVLLVLVLMPLAWAWGRDVQRGVELWRDSGYPKDWRRK